jgi:ATP-dependent DNA helicase RecG
MDDAELEALLRDLESDRSERTESAKDRDKIGEAICAFANDLPGSGESGVLFVGARDDGSCAGISVTDEMLRTLSDYRSDARVQPIPSLIVQKRTIAGCEMAVLIVQPSEAPPVRYKGRVCVRTGPRRDFATPEQERQLNERRRGRDLPFDVRPVKGSTLDDLDLEFFQKQYLISAVNAEVLAQNQRPIKQQLASLRFVTPTVPPVPTVAGILAIGRDPEQFIGGAYLQFIRFDGLTRADPIRDEKRISGPLPEVLRRIDEVLTAHIAVEVDFTSGPLEVRRPDFPLVALQQVIRNAVMHRNYDGTNAPVRISWFTDRIEISSPGGPFGQVSVANFGQPDVTDYRNRHIAEVLHNLGFVQRFGAGIALTRSSMEKNGNPPPEFGVYPEHIQVTLRRHR